MARPEILLHSVQTEPLDLTSLEIRMVPRLEMAARVVGRWAYEHELMTSTKLFEQLDKDPEGMILLASEIRRPNLEWAQQNQHFIKIEFYDAHPDRVIAKFVALTFGPGRRQKLRTKLTMESPIDRLLFTKTQGEFLFSDEQRRMEFAYTYSIQEHVGEFKIGPPDSDPQNKILIAYVRQDRLEYVGDWPHDTLADIETMLPLYNKKTFERLIYGMIYGLDLVGARSSEMFLQKATTLIHSVAKAGTPVSGENERQPESEATKQNKE